MFYLLSVSQYLHLFFLLPLYLLMLHYAMLMDKRRCIYRDFRWVEVYVVDSAAGKMSPARGQPLFDGLERYIEVDDCINTVGAIQGLSLGNCPRETYKCDTDRGETEGKISNY